MSHFYRVEFSGYKITCIFGFWEFWEKVQREENGHGMEEKSEEDCLAECSQGDEE